MRVRRRSGLGQFGSTLAAILLIAAAIPSVVSAATVDDLVARAKANWKMTCLAGGGQISCTNDSTPLWTLRILPTDGPIDAVLTDVAPRDLPLDPTSIDWMSDMQQFACGDPKGIQAFVTQVGALLKPANLGPVVIGTCNLTGGLISGAAAPFYRVLSQQRPPSTPGPTLTPAPTATPAPPTPTPAPTTKPSASAAASAAASASVDPTASSSTSPTGSPAAPTGEPSAVVGGVETGPPSPAPTGAVAGVGATPAPTQPTFEQSVLGITDVNVDGGAIAGSLLLALLLLLIVGFAGELFNNTIENNYAHVSGWLRRRPLRWLRQLGGRFRGDAPIGLVVFLALTALISSFVDPRFGFDLRSLGVYLGFLVGLAIVLAAFKLPPMLAHRRETGDLGRLRPLPWALVIAALFVVVSRIGNLQPGYLYGIVLGVLFVKEVSPKEEGRHTFFGSLWTLGAAVLGWLGLTWLRGLGLDPDGFAVTLAATACAAVMVAGLEATAFGLMPLRFMPGYAVYRWSRLAWALLWGLSLFGFLHILIAPVSGYVSQLSPQAFAAALGVFAAFGALSIAVWGYFRFRGPAATPAEVRFD